jgi:ribonuclease D
LDVPLPSQAGDLTKSLKSFVREQTATLKIAPEAMMKRNVLDPLVRHLFDGSPVDWQNPAIKGWRRDVIVDPILNTFKK